MAENLEYIDLDSLIKKLGKNAKKMKDGKLSFDEVAAMVEDSREVYERLVILAYKAGEAEFGPIEDATAALEAEAKTDAELLEAEANAPEPEPEVIKEPIAEEPVVEEPIAEKEETTEPVQEPNTPAAEEIVAKAKEEAPKAEEKIEEPEPVAEEVVEEIEEEESKKEEAPIAPQNQTSLIDAIQQAEDMSVNDTASDPVAGSVADKLGKTPIDDLGTAIGVNQKFLFMNDLFGGENTAYSEAVSQLNSFTSYEEAKNYIDNALVGTYNWDMESESAATFIDLVSRRYASA